MSRMPERKRCQMRVAERLAYVRDFVVAQFITMMKRKYHAAEMNCTSEVALLVRLITIQARSEAKQCQEIVAHDR